MARFYGSVQGNRGQATRLGHTTLDVSAQSYNGDIRVQLYDHEGTDWCRIWAEVHKNRGGGDTFTIYCGPISDLLSTAARKALVLAAATEELRKQTARDPQDTAERR